MWSLSPNVPSLPLLASVILGVLLTVGCTAHSSTEMNSRSPTPSAPTFPVQFRWEYVLNQTISQTENITAYGIAYFRVNGSSAGHSWRFDEVYERDSSYVTDHSFETLYWLGSHIYIIPFYANGTRLCYHIGSIDMGPNLLKSSACTYTGVVTVGNSKANEWRCSWPSSGMDQIWDMDVDSGVPLQWQLVGEGFPQPVFRTLHFVAENTTLAEDFFTVPTDIKCK